MLKFINRIFGVKKLYLIERIDDLPHDDDPWEPSWDKGISMVIRAKSESSARKLAAYQDDVDWEAGNPWLSPKYSTCIELFYAGKEEVIVCAWHHG
jgi:hypothetical protein